MKTIVFAVAILSACLMQGVSGAPISADSKPEAKTALKEEVKKVGDAKQEEALEDADDEEDMDAEDEDDTDDEGEDEEDDDDQDGEDKEPLSLIETNEEDEVEDGADGEDQDEQEEELPDEASQKDDADDDAEFQFDEHMQQKLMSQAVQTLYAKAEELRKEADKVGASAESLSAAGQADKDLGDAVEKELKEKGEKWEDEARDAFFNEIEKKEEEKDAGEEKAEKAEEEADKA